MANHIRRPIEDRLFEKLAPRDNGCVEFTGAIKQNGYGAIHRPGHHGQLAYAHRVAWEINNGPIDAGLEVCHRCDNRRCCNPDHLFLGTRTDNMQDAKRKGRTSLPPHEYGERHHKATVSDAEVRECREQYAAGMSAREIAALHGIPHYSVWHWVTGRGRLRSGGPIPKRAA